MCGVFRLTFFATGSRQSLPHLSFSKIVCFLLLCRSCRHLCIAYLGAHSLSSDVTCTMASGLYPRAVARPRYSSIIVGVFKSNCEEGKGIVGFHWLIPISQDDILISSLNVNAFKLVAKHLPPLLYCCCIELTSNMLWSPPRRNRSESWLQKLPSFRHTDDSRVCIEPCTITTSHVRRRRHFVPAQHSNASPNIVAENTSLISSSSLNVPDNAESRLSFASLSPFQL